MNNIINENYSIAVRRFYDYSTGDPTSVIAREHGLIGFTRIITCMQHIGLNHLNIDFIALPDFTFTRNKFRWNAGFPYGCIIRFHKDEVPFIPVDFRPNCCGVIFAELPEFNDSALTLQQKYHDIVCSYSDIDSSDLNRRNHFMGIYKNENNQKFYFLLHGSFEFAKKALYSEKNETLALGMKSEMVMGEPFSYLIGHQAKAYYDNYKKFETLTIQYRELITKTLFPNAKIIFHRTHEGFNELHTILLGAYADNKPFDCPIMLAPECDLVLIKNNKPIQIDDKPSLYCAPHGGGYAIGELSMAKRIDFNLEGMYVLTYPNNSEMFTNSILDLPFYYRTQSERVWCEKYHMANELLRLKPILNLKV